MSKRASATESTCAEEEAKGGGGEGEGRVGEEASAASAAAALKMLDLAVLILRLLGFACAGVALVVFVILRGDLGDETRGDDAHGSVEDASDIGAQRRRLG
jgi:hypothetical protein